MSAAGERTPLGELLLAAVALVDSEASLLRKQDPAGCAKVDAAMRLGMTPRLVVTLGSDPEVRCMLMNDLGDEVLQVFVSAPRRLIIGGSAH